MNFGGAFSNSQDRDFSMSALWVPVTPEKTTSLSQVDKHANVVRQANWQVPANRNAHMQEMLNYNNAVPNLNPLCQAIQNGGYSNYTRNVDDSHILNPVVMQQMLHYTNSSQNLKLLGHSIQNREHGNYNGGLTQKSKMTNHIAGSFSQALMGDDTRLNNNSLEFLLMNNGVHSDDERNGSVMPASSGQLNCQEINSTKEYCANYLYHNSQYHLGMDQPYNSLEGLVSSGISLNGSLFSMDTQCSVSNPRSSSEIVSQIPQYHYQRPFETRYNPHLWGTDNFAGSSITNSNQMASTDIIQAKLLSEKSRVQNSSPSDGMLNKETNIQCENTGNNSVQIQQNISAEEIGNLKQVQTEIQKHHTIKEVMAQNNQMPVGKIIPTAYGGMNYEKQYSHTNYKHVPTINVRNTSVLHQEIIEVDENDKILNRNLSRSIEQIGKGFNTDICGIKPGQARVEGGIKPNTRTLTLSCIQ